MDNGCLANGKKTVETTITSPTIDIIFSYYLDDGMSVDYWIIYDESGVEFSRVNYGDLYTHTEPGEYFVKPIFNQS